VITSLDVIIHHDQQLGSGGFGKVFKATWLGTTVAVKQMDDNTPSAVSNLNQAD
jgi:hypothetical protein